MKHLWSWPARVNGHSLRAAVEHWREGTEEGYTVWYQVFESSGRVEVGAGVGVVVMGCWV